MTALPTGTVTFLLTDIVGSARHWEREPEGMGKALRIHDELTAAVVARCGGAIPDQGEGDSKLCAFARPTQAAAAALELQLALGGQDWGLAEPLLVRMAIHTGEAEHRDQTYFGPAVNRAGRLRSIAEGGQILVSAASADLIREALPDDAGLDDLGVVRLKDLDRPENVFQLVHPSLPSTFPPLAGAERTPNNLPEHLTNFIGREEALKEISALLETRRLVTLVGAGGAGKTRLALRLADVVMKQFPGGVFLIELARLTEPGLVAMAVAGALGVREKEAEETMEGIIDRLQNGRTLLLLDNCEHLVDEAAHFAEALLRRAPLATVLATSRERISVPGEVVWRVPSMTFPSVQTPETMLALAGYEAPRLFLDRAALADPNFVVNPEGIASIAEICRRLDGIPLATELAAARVSTLTPAQISERLDDRFRLLTGGGRTTAPRHQTLRATVDWSYDLLGERERRAFARMAAFAGGFTLEAAEVVCECGGDTLEILTSLVDKSLVGVEQRAGYVRYSLLETLRTYAEERAVELGEEAEARERHLRWFRRLAEEAEENLSGPEVGRWLELLEGELDNLRTALSFAIQNGRREQGLRLAAALTRYFEVRGRQVEAMGYLRSLLDGNELRRTSIGSKALRGLSRLAMLASDFETSESAAREGLEISESLGDETGIARSLQALANLELGRARYPAAESLYSRALEIQKRLRDRRGSAITLANLGVIAWAVGDYAKSRTRYEEALSAQRDLEDKRGVAASLNNLGVLMQVQGDLAGARDSFLEAHAVLEELADRRGAAAALGNLGNISYFLGDVRGARDNYQQALTIHRELGERAMMVESTINLGNLAMSEGDLTGARKLIEEALEAARELGEQSNIATCLQSAADAAAREGNPRDGIPLIRESLELRRDLEDRRGLAEALEIAASIAAGLGRAQDSARLLGFTDSLREEIGAPAPPPQHQDTQRLLSALQADLGEVAMKAALNQGRSLSSEDAMAIVLAI